MKNNTECTSYDSEIIERELVELFKEWKIAHENDDFFVNTCIEGKAEDLQYKTSFIPDGCVDFQEYSEATTKVLFILKEPASNREKGEPYYGLDSIETLMKSHWYKVLVDGEGIIDGNKGRGNRNKNYYRKFKIMSDKLGSEIRKTAFMNLNKRGGYSKGTKDSVLKEYTDVFGEFIHREISILKPDIIVSCIGNGCIKDLLFDDSYEWYDININEKSKCNLFKTTYNSKSVVYGMQHPGSRMGYNNYEKIFEKLFELVNDK